MARKPARKPRKSPAKAAAKARSTPSRKPVDCVIGICDGFNLLIPSTVVAEVVSGVASEFVDDVERLWLQGALSWRGQTVPLISLESHLLGRTARIRGSHVAILRGTQNPDSLPFYGVTIQAFPHSVQIQSDRELESRQDNRYDNILAATAIRGIAVVIPDLDRIQNSVLAEEVPDLESESG